MIYALVGIPLTLLLLTAVVERLLIPTTALLQWMNRKMGHLHTPFCIRIMHLLVVSIVGNLEKKVIRLNLVISFIVKTIISIL